MSSSYQTCAPFEDGVPLIKWIREISNECVYGEIEAFSWISQYISIGVWVAAGTYQSWQLYKHKDVSGFSEGFLFCWTIGAFLNVLGCLCTGQMAFQVVLGFYFLFSDTFLYLQYKYYANRPWLAVQHQEELMEERELLISPDTDISYSTNQKKTRQSSISKNESTTRSYSTFAPSVALGIAYGSSPAAGAPIPAVLTSSAPSTPQILLILTAAKLIIGNFASWTSNTLYTVSRLPQIKRNFERKSCEGVSPALFIATLVGNLSYCFTIACAWKAIPDPVEARAFFVTEVPFIAGAVSTTLADVIIFAQFYLYKDNVYEELESMDYDDERIMVIEARSMSDDDDDDASFSCAVSSHGDSKGRIASSYSMKH